MLWMSLTYVLDWMPNSFLSLPVLLVFGNISLLRSQINRCHTCPGHISISALQVNVQIYILKAMCISNRCLFTYVCQRAWFQIVGAWIPKIEPESCPFTDEVAEIHCHFTEGFKNVFELSLFTEIEEKMLKLLLEQVILLGRRWVHMEMHGYCFIKRCQFTTDLVDCCCKMSFKILWSCGKKQKCTKV